MVNGERRNLNAEWKKNNAVLIAIGSRLRKEESGPDSYRERNEEFI